MRAAWKLTTIVAIAVLLHVLVQRYEGHIDEAQFAARSLLLYLQTGRADSTEVMDAAIKLRDRQVERHNRRVAAARGEGGMQEPAVDPEDQVQPATRPAKPSHPETVLAVAEDGKEATGPPVVIRPAR